MYPSILGTHTNLHALAFSTPFTFTTFHCPIHSQSPSTFNFCHLDGTSFSHHLFSIIHKLIQIDSKLNAQSFPHAPHYPHSLHSTAHSSPCHHPLSLLTVSFPVCPSSLFIPPAPTGPMCLCLVTHLSRQKSLIYCSGFSLAAHTNTTLNTNGWNRMESDHSLGGRQFRARVAAPRSPKSWLLLCCTSAKLTCYLMVQNDHSQ